MPNRRTAAILAAFFGAGKMPALRSLPLYSAILNKSQEISTHYAKHSMAKAKPTH
jgi:hypothetical protein